MNRMDNFCHRKCLLFFLPFRFLFIWAWMGFFAIELNMEMWRPSDNNKKKQRHKDQRARCNQTAEERREILISKPQLSYNGIIGTNKTANECLFVEVIVHLIVNIIAQPRMEKKKINKIKVCTQINTPLAFFKRMNWGKNHSHHFFTVVDVVVAAIIDIGRGWRQRRWSWF